MTNPKHALRLFAALGISAYVFLIIAAITFRDPQIFFALLWAPLFLAVLCAVVTGVWMITLWPLVLLIARVFDRTR
jgi:hypothetical protein